MRDIVMSGGRYSASNCSVGTLRSGAWALLQTPDASTCHALKCHGYLQVAGTDAAEEGSLLLLWSMKEVKSAAAWRAIVASGAISTAARTAIVTRAVGAKATAAVLILRLHGVSLLLWLPGRSQCQ